MAGSSMKDIKLRIRSVESTMQITKAMQLVASSKLRGARNRMEASRPYMQTARETMQDIVNHNLGADSGFARAREVKRRLYIVVAGDRGLAGSYNANVCKSVDWAAMDPESFEVIPIGRKAHDFFAHRGVVMPARVEKVENLSVEDCMPLAELAMERFESGVYDEVNLIYTTFVSVLTQTPRMLRLLPILPEKTEGRQRQMLCEPGAEGLLRGFMAQYLAGVIHSAACEAFASEQAARRVAMDSATKNAGDMIEDLNLRYNRARQSSITQELTEIVAGAEQS